MANPHADSKYETNRLPGFNKEPFDGKPVYFFDKIWFIPFIVACGNIQQDGWTLHQTFYGTDLGGVNNPGGNAAQQAQHRLRVHRLYNVLMHHLKPNTSLYRELSEQAWISQGVLACQMVQRRGNKPLSEDYKTELEHEWNELTTEKLNLDIYSGTLIDLYEEIDDLASKIGKTKIQIYTKFLQACPPQMAPVVANEKMSPNPQFVYPAHYQAGHPLHNAAAPVAHPNAGLKNTLKMCHVFTAAWEGMIASGAVRTRIKKEKSEKSVNLVGKGGKKTFGGGGRSNDKLKPKRADDEKSCCYRCGGLGHVAKMTIENGTVVECATRITIPKDVLNGITYPHIPSANERREAYRNKKNGKSVKEIADEAEHEEEEEQVNAEEELDSSDEEAQYQMQLNEDE